MSLDFLQPPGDDDAHGAHAPNWTLDLPDGLTEADLAGDLIRELEAEHVLVGETSVWVRRGDEGEWREVTPEELRRRRGEA